MASCISLKKSAMSPLPAAPDPAANPGEFALIDNEDGTLTLAIVDAGAHPSPIAADAASLEVESSESAVVEVGAVKDFTWREEAAKSTASAPSQPSQGKGGAVKHPPGASPSATHHARQPAAVPAVAREVTVTATVTWTATNLGTHKLTWKDEVAGGVISRGPVTVEHRG